MIVVKCFVFMLSCLLLTMCQAMENKKDLQRIEEKDLPGMAGKPVIFESLQHQYKTGILYKPLGDALYLIITSSGPDKKQGVSCLKSKIFYANDIDLGS